MKKQGILTDSDINKLERRFKKVFLTRSELDLDYLTKRLEKNFLTKEEFNDYKDDIFNKLDKILHELVSTREEMIALSHHSSDHEDRLELIEKIHPQGKHIS